MVYEEVMREKLAELNVIIGSFRRKTQRVAGFGWTYKTILDKRRWSLRHAVLL